MADQDPGEMSALVRLMLNRDDLSGLTDDEVIQAMREGAEAAVRSHEAKRVSEIWGAAELESRGWKPSKIARALGVHRAQPRRWVQEHPSYKGGDGDE